MASATPAKLMSVEEFRALPEPVTGPRPELQFGEVVVMTQPKFKHVHMSRKLQFLLAEKLSAFGYVDKELPFRALPQNDCRAADVGFISNRRLSLIDPEDNLAGAPDLVIEVLSPSNSAAEMYERELLCLENGSIEFWIVNLEKSTIRVASRDAASRVYRKGETISLAAFGGGELNMNEVFG